MRSNLAIFRSHRNTTSIMICSTVWVMKHLPIFLVAVCIAACGDDYITTPVPSEDGDEGSFESGDSESGDTGELPPEDLWAPGDEDLGEHCTSSQEALCEIFADIIHGAALLACDGIVAIPEDGDLESSEGAINGAQCPRDMCIAAAHIARAERVRNCYAECGSPDPITTDIDLKCARVEWMEHMACLLGRAPACTTEDCEGRAIDANVNCREQ